MDERLENELADVIAQVMRLADHCRIDLEKAFMEAGEDEDRYLRPRGASYRKVKLYGGKYDIG